MDLLFDARVAALYWNPSLIIKSYSKNNQLFPFLFFYVYEYFIYMETEDDLFLIKYIKCCLLE